MGFDRIGWHKAAYRHGNNLDGRTKGLISALFNYLGPDGRGYPTRRRLAADMSTGQKTVARCVKHAEDAGWIKVSEIRPKGKGQPRNLYQATFPEEVSHLIIKNTPEAKTETLLEEKVIPSGDHKRFPQGINSDSSRGSLLPYNKQYINSIEIVAGQPFSLPSFFYEGTNSKNETLPGQQNCLTSKKIMPFPKNPPMTDELETPSPQVPPVPTPRRQDENEKHSSEDVENATEYIRHFNEITGKDYNTTDEDIQKLVAVRLAEDYTVDDLRSITEIKYHQWVNCTMESSIRPDILLGKKFKDYYQEVVAARRATKQKIHGTPTLKELMNG